MKQAALLLTGRHDFKNFSTVKRSKSTEKEIYDIDIYANSEEMQISIHANDFLHNMAGRHDFKNFSTVKRSKSTEKEIYDIDIYANSEEMQISIHANDFLHNMARMIIGTLLDIGLGKRKKEEIEQIFTGKLPASAPCDPKGLYLQEIIYKSIEK